jgi:hypothetical protein
MLKNEKGRKAFGFLFLDLVLEPGSTFWCAFAATEKGVWGLGLLEYLMHFSRFF